MSKVIKAFSLDRRTVEILENYCRQSDNWDKKISRSKVVNDAIVWFLSGDVAELVHNREALVERIKQMNLKLDAAELYQPPKKSWWRQILGF